MSKIDGKTTPKRERITRGLEHIRRGRPMVKPIQESNQSVLNMSKNISFSDKSHDISLHTTPGKHPLQSDSSFLNDNLDKPYSKQLLKDQITLLLKDLDREQPSFTYTDRKPKYKPTERIQKSAPMSPIAEPNLIGENYFLKKNYSSLASHLKMQEETKVVQEDKLDNLKSKISELKATNAVKLESERLKTVNLQQNLHKLQRNPQVSSLIEIYEDDINRLEKHICNLRLEIVDFCDKFEMNNRPPTLQKAKDLKLIETVKKLENELLLKDAEIFKLKKHQRTFIINRKFLESINNKTRSLQHALVNKTSLLKENDEICKESEDIYEEIAGENRILREKLEKNTQETQFLNEELKSLKETAYNPHKITKDPERRQALHLIDRLQRELISSGSTKSLELLKNLKEEIENIYVSLQDKQDREHSLLDMLVDIQTKSSHVEHNKKLRKDLLSMI